MVAVDAGAMQIQLWKGAGWRCAEAALQGMTHHAGRPEIGLGEQIPPLKRREERICCVSRQRDTQRVEACGAFVLQRVSSCGRADLRWRPKLDFGSGEPFDDLHGPSTLRTLVKIRSVLGGGSEFFGRRFL